MNIENKNYKLSFIAEGAQLVSWLDKRDGHEFIHDGKTGWGQHNPTLFPIVGKLVGGTYCVNDTEYAMGQHGVVRRANFVGTTTSENSICFSFESNEDTKKIYPFDFKFEKEYILEENRLIITHRVTNTGKSLMPFSIGHHPAFKCDFEKGVTVEFEREESLNLVKFEEGGYFSHEYYAYGEPSRSIAMPYDKNLLDTLVFTNLKSSHVTMVSEDHRVSVSTVGFPYFGVWYNEGGFACLEPWLAHSSYLDTSKDLFKKEDMYLLESGRSFLNSYSIEVI